jgi:hypothetical protein
MLSASLNSRSRLIWRTLAVILALLLIQHFLIFRRSDSATWPSSNHGHQPVCDSIQGLEDVLVVMKTGANEAPEKLPVHFDTTLRCVPHYVLYSDMEEDIAGHHVYNVLDDVSPEVVANHPDFEYYRQLQAQGRDAFTPEQMAEWASAKNTGGGRNSPGWRLDKWKFLPAAEKAYELRPDANWFVFIESDSYIVWSALVKWLSRFDASKPHYLGQQMQIGDVVFAYGGAGFAISRPALKKVVELRKSKLDFYDEFTGNHWAGDCVLGKALADAGVNLFWSWPTLVSEHPSDMDFLDNFGGADKKLWCYYAGSYHHLNPTEITRLNDFETKWHHEVSTPTKSNGSDTLEPPLTFLCVLERNSSTPRRCFPILCPPSTICEAHRLGQPV